MYINIGHRKLFYQWINRTNHTERKPVIIFLHEGLGSIAQWKDFPTLLCERLDLQGLVYEREGYGHSSFWPDEIPDDYLIQEALEVLPELIHKLNIRQYYLFGHSDGATIALFHATKPQTGLLAMAIEAPHVVIEKNTMGALQNAATLNPDFIMKLDKYQHGRASKLVGLWSNFWLNPDRQNWTMVDYLTSISCPMILIQGDEDQFGSFLQLEIIKEKTQSIIAELRLENCGHIPHLQYPVEVMDATAHFFLK
ncbi:MAG: alpha/beta hydrolase [Bacteroidales bacterium]|nr:alpha/beta hydrolase [Bacteroidales bacterium]